MRSFQGFTTLLFMVCISYLIAGFYTILPYWLVVSAIESSNLLTTLMFSIGIAFWVFIVLGSVVGLGKQGRVK